jgi:WD40 repeat protein
MNKSNSISKKNPFKTSKGPSSDITLSPEHGGPIMCMDIQNDIVVTGSTDHGLRVYSLSTGKQMKQLYSKSFGHTEWVTAVTFLPDGRIVSGGMDSNLCVWESKGVKCKFITEHTGSISKLMADETGICLSSSYDTSVRIFDMNSVECIGVLKGTHKTPVTQFNWQNSLCVTGARDGSVAIWDVNTQQCIMSQTSHSGQVMQIVFHSDDLDNNLILTAGSNDGSIVSLDMRSNSKVSKKRVN